VPRNAGPTERLSRGVAANPKPREPGRLLRNRKRGDQPCTSSSAKTVRRIKARDVAVVVRRLEK